MNNNAGNAMDVLLLDCHEKQCCVHETVDTGLLVMAVLDYHGQYCCPGVDSVNAELP